MKKYNQMMAVVFVVFIGVLVITNSYFSQMNFKESSREYKVSVNRIQQEIKKYEEQKGRAPDSLEEIKIFSQISEYPFIYSVDSIKIKGISAQGLKNLLEQEGENYLMFTTDENLYRIDYYAESSASRQTMKFINAFVIIILLIMLSVLLYIKKKIIAPFYRFSQIPLELSKGNLTVPLKEEKNRYFGKFIWGMDLLRENLEENKVRELKLQKERKLLLLSLSHDIKTPLSAIKLYAKAISKNLYNKEEKKQEVAEHISEKVDEIEEYISEIVKASKEDFMEFEVENREFYIRNVLDSINEYYQEKMKLNHIDFSMESYHNCLVWGDENRLVEVIQNIIENACKYGDGRKIWLETKREAEECLIIIRNTGCTLEEKELPHICDSFFRGSNVEKETGSGLGLYICRKLMHLMEGELIPNIILDSHGKLMEVTVVVQIRN